MGLKELDLLKSTLIKIDEIDKKISKEESLRKNTKHLIKNMRDVEAPTKPSLKIDMMVTIGDFYDYSKDQLKAKLRSENHLEIPSDIDLLRLEYIKKELAKEYMKMSKVELIEMYNGIGENVTKSVLIDRIIQREFDTSKFSDMGKRFNMDELKRICKQEKLPTSGKKKILIARILCNKHRDSFGEKVDLSDFEHDEVLVEIEKINISMEEELTEDKRAKKQFEDYISGKRNELSGLEASFFEGKSPDEHFDGQKKDLEKTISGKQSNIAVALILPIFLLLLILGIFASFGEVTNTLASVSAIVVALSFIFYKISNYRLEKFIRTENDKLDEIELELAPQLHIWNEINDEISSVEREEGRRINNHHSRMNNKMKKLSKLEEIIYKIKDVEKQYNKQIEAQIKAQQKLEIEMEKATKKLDKVKINVKKLKDSKNQLWKEIKHLIPYSNIV